MSSHTSEQTTILEDVGYPGRIGSAKEFDLTIWCSPDITPDGKNVYWENVKQTGTYVERNEPFIVISCPGDVSNYQSMYDVYVLTSSETGWISAVNEEFKVSE